MDTASTNSDYAVYRQLVTQLLEGEEVLPSLPNLTFEIRSAISAPRTTIPQLEQLISRDPALSALLVKQASSALYRQARAPQNLRDVISLIGMKQLGVITMSHSVKSLFTLYSPGYKRLFVQVWEQMVMKAATCSALARKTARIAPEHALLACLLSEVGNLVVLSAFRSQSKAPEPEDYYRLCKQYSQSLGVMLLRRWSVEQEYIEIIRHAGDWTYSQSPHLETVDLVNLTLHQASSGSKQSDLPPITEISAYQKLLAPQNQLDVLGRLRLIVDNQQEIQEIARTLR